MVRKCTFINKIPWKGMCSTCAIIFRTIEILHHHFRNSHHQSLYFIHPHCTYILWSKIIFGLKFIFLYFRIWQCMIMSQWWVWKKQETKIEKKKKERNFEPRIKLSHNIYIPGINVSPLLYKGWASNRPFFGCGLCALAFEWMCAQGWACFDTNLFP